MSIYLNTNQKSSCSYEENTVLLWSLKMKNWRSLIALSAITLAALFGAGCKSSEPSKSDGAVTDAKKVRTTVTKDNLKARLTMNKVKFIEKEEDPTLTEGEVARREVFPLPLKIVSVESEPNVEFHGRVYKLHEFSSFNKDTSRIDEFALPATEADIAFYNSKGIAVEDFEEVIRSLDESVEVFAVDFLGHENPTGVPHVASMNRDVTAPMNADVTGPKVELKDEPPPPPPTPSPQSERAPVSAGEMSGKVISRVEPTYSPAARAVGASGPVKVQILVDEDGNVVTASAISGHPLLQASAVEAVRQWRFAPLQLSGQRVKVRGTVTVNFKP